jgi:tRNA pseudouridine(38-40) synthase
LIRGVRGGLCIVRLCVTVVWSSLVGVMLRSGGIFMMKGAHALVLGPHPRSIVVVGRQRSSVIRSVCLSLSSCTAVRTSLSATLSSTRRWDVQPSNSAGYRPFSSGPRNGDALAPSGHAQSLGPKFTVNIDDFTRRRGRPSDLNAQDRPKGVNKRPPNPETITAPKERVKRKVAIAFGYVGTNYSGLQYNPVAHVRTIEGVIKDALASLGYIKPANQDNLAKIGWSRSSRTDKGVHAARILVSAKLEFKSDLEPTEEFETEELKKQAERERKRNSHNNNNNQINEAQLSRGTLRYHDIIDELNSVLPSDVRALSCIRVPGGFNSRQTCTWREYEYIFPAEMLLSRATLDKFKQQEQGIDATVFESEEFKVAMERCQTALRKMEGTQSFHNFHRLSGKNLRSRTKGRPDRRSRVGDATRDTEASTVSADSDDAMFAKSLALEEEMEASDDHNNNQNDEEDDEDVGDADADAEVGSDDVASAERYENLSQFDLNNLPPNKEFIRDFVIEKVFYDWKPTPRTICAKTKRSVYICEAELLWSLKTKEAEEIKLQTPIVKVLVRGQSFMLQ